MNNFLAIVFLGSVVWNKSDSFSIDLHTNIRGNTSIKYRRQIEGELCIRIDQFKCNDGQCLDIEAKCNGTAECNDKSDETEELCLNFFCFGYSYKCNYGACIDGNNKCDGIQDCIDNSDESEETCGPTTRTAKVGNKCITPEQPKHGQWVYLNNYRRGDSHEPVDFKTVLIFSCREGYSLSANENDKYSVYCDATGNWSEARMPTCQRTIYSAIASIFSSFTVLMYLLIFLYSFCVGLKRRYSKED